MKRFYRVLAVILAATMLMCCCAFAIDDEKKPLTRDNYGCSCGPRGCSAYTSASDAVGSISASYSGTITNGDNSEFSVGGSETRYNYDYASCGETYSQAATGYIYSSHSIENSHYFSGDSF